MELILQILGGLFLLLVVVLVGGFFYVRARFRRAVQGFVDTMEEMAMAGPMPPRVNLSPEPEPEWRDPAKVQRLTEALQAEGFVETGTYEADEIYGLLMRGFAHPTDEVYAVVYEQPQVGAWLDFVTRFADGGSLTHSDAPRGDEIDSRPGHDKHYQLDGDAATLYASHLAERGDRARQPADPERFVEAFEKAYADEMDWRNSRGGPTDEEIRRVAAKDGKELTDEELAMIRDQQHRNAVAGLTTALHERFLETTTLSAAEWDRMQHRVVFVHDQLTREMLVELFSEHADWDAFYDEDREDDDDYDVEEQVQQRYEAVLPPTSESARAAFAAANAALPEKERFERIGELTEPVPADVYAAPEYE